MFQEKPRQKKLSAFKFYVHACFIRVFVIKKNNGLNENIEKLKTYKYMYLIFIL